MQGRCRWCRRGAGAVQGVQGRDGAGYLRHLHLNKHTIRCREVQEVQAHLRPAPASAAAPESIFIGWGFQASGARRRPDTYIQTSISQAICIRQEITEVERNRLRNSLRGANQKVIDGVRLASVTGSHESQHPFLLGELLVTFLETSLLVLVITKQHLTE